MYECINEVRENEKNDLKKKIELCIQAGNMQKSDQMRRNLEL